MGLIYADIELINGFDLEMARRLMIGEEEVKRMPITALVDTGSYMLAINETIQEQLQFPIVEKRKAQLANGHIVACEDMDVLIHPLRQELIINPEHPYFAQMKMK